jgi:hypothetical protein
MGHDTSPGDGLSRRGLYRLPWSLHDNPVGWVEITDACNIKCKGCYRTALAGHKPLDDIKTEIRFLEEWRNINNVHLAGGEPLIHPDIVDIVRFIRGRGLNPVIITNGQRLTRELLVNLRDAGLVEMSFHVDSGQTRPEWSGRDERELNQLRQHFTDLLWEVGGVNCNFNMTVNPRTVPRVPEVIQWALGTRGKVSGLTFITLRGFPREGVKFAEGGRVIDLNSPSIGMVNDVEDEMSALRSDDVFRVIKEAFPQYAAASYLGGTRTPASVKWLIASAVCSGEDWVGSVSPTTVEMTQIFHHLRRGRYYAGGRGNPGKRILLMAAVDRRIRGALLSLLKTPSRLFGRVYTLTVSVIEPNTLLPDGEYEMCDSCPDMTYYDGRLVNSCRLDEYRLYGALAKPVVDDADAQRLS